MELCTKLIDAAVAEGAELLIGAAEGVQTEPDGEIERVTGVSSAVHKLTAPDLLLNLLVGAFVPSQLHFFRFTGL